MASRLLACLGGDGGDEANRRARLVQQGSRGTMLKEILNVPAKEYLSFRDHIRQSYVLFNDHGQGFSRRSCPTPQAMP